MALQESGEMYLECIHLLIKQQKNVRSIDVAEYMNYSKPSVSRAVGILKRSGHIRVDENGFITLTELGMSVADMIYERHQLLSKLLISLGVSEAVAAADACKIEHVISEETFEAVKERFGR